MVTPPTPGADERAVEVGMLRSFANRRSFLKWSGAAAATALIAACDQPTAPAAILTPSQDGTATAGSTGGVTIDLASDVGILNFAYALEQLEAAFYIQVKRNGFYPGATGEEKDILADIKNHEVTHREFFKAALGSAAIPGLAVDFSGVDFNSRAQVLGAAKALEDTGVGAYNGAAQFLDNNDYLDVAAKIVSVEARHASAIRDLLGNSFAPSAFDPALTFEQVLQRAAPFIATNITLAHSPTAGHAGSGAEEMDS